METPGFRSGDQLIPHLGRLREELTVGKLPEERKPTSLPLHLELLPYSLGAACLAVSELVYSQYLVVQSVLGRAARNSTIHVLSPEDRDRMAFRVDAFLDAARRTQNGTIHYFARAYGLSLPDSLDKLVVHASGTKSPLPPYLTQLVTSYWSESGKRLKDYRDVAQHHGLVASEGRAFFRPNGDPAIFLMLPSNPEAKNPQKFRYERPAVHALPYCWKAFFELMRFVYRATKPLLAPGPGNRVRLIAIRTPVRIDSDEPEGAPLMSTTAFRRELPIFLRSLDEESNGGLGGGEEASNTGPQADS
jgi:hypothetical protein